MPRRLVVLALLCCTAGCNACSRSTSSTLTLLADAAPPPSFTSAARADASVELDDLWKRAIAGDPIDLASLADREGASGLLAGVEHGGEVGVTALRALPYADDSELALRRLGEIALQLDGKTQREVVDAIHAIASRPAQQREVLDATGARACGDALIELTRKGGVPKETRAVAVSSLRSLAERMVVDPARIPTDFDPR